MKATCAYIDFWAGGHHADYLSYIIHHLAEKVSLPRRFIFVIGGDLLKELGERLDIKAISRHPDIVIDELDDSTIYGCRDRSLVQLRACFNQARLVLYIQKKWAAQSIHCDHLNSLQVWLPFVDRLLKAKVSGVLYHPYVRMFDGKQSSLASRFNYWRKQCQITALLRCNCFGRGFILNDAAATRYLNRHRLSRDRFTAIGDPARLKASQTPDVIAKNKAAFGVPNNRFVMAIVGVIKPRKGIAEVMAAFREMPSEVVGELCLFLAGSLDGYTEIEWQQMEGEFRRACPNVSIVTCFKRLDCAQYEAALSIGDCHLLLYTDSHGSSGVLGDAIRHGKQVIGSRYGLLGSLIQRYDLGLTADPRDSTSVGAAMIKIQSSTHEGNHDGRSRYLSERTHDRFARRIVSELLTD